MIARWAETNWRRGGDSNPQYPFRYVRFRGGSFQPLTHLSASDDIKQASLLCWRPSSPRLCVSAVNVLTPQNTWRSDDAPRWRWSTARDRADIRWSTARRSLLPDAAAQTT